MTDMPMTSELAVSQPKTAHRAVVLWLFAVAGLIFLMVMVGGATRLTGSGLSMTDWRPVTGVLPPLNAEAWQAEFTKYQQSPEYQLVNAGMSLEEFKSIFYWEWGHRVLGRLIGLAYALPLLFFWIRGMVPAGYKPRLLLLLFLGGGQGLLGWYMVQSGLVDVPEVSHYRLVAHLSLALTLFSAVLWTGLDIQGHVKTAVSKQLRGAMLFALILIVLQMVMGGLVAGLEAGWVANDWPTMAGQIIPDDIGALNPWYVNPIDNPVTAHFDHRIGAYLLFLVSLYLVWRSSSESSQRARFLTRLVLAAVTTQATLGIVTILLSVPVFWGTLHQGGGVVVLASVLYMVHQTKRT